MVLSLEVLYGERDDTNVSGWIKKVFELFDNASKDGQIVFEGWEKLNFANLANMAAIKTYLGLGGAAKVIKFFWYCYPNVGENICAEYKVKHT